MLTATVAQQYQRTKHLFPYLTLSLNSPDRERYICSLLEEKSTMGINRRHRNRTSEGNKFTLARITSAKFEAETLDNLVEQDMDLLYLGASDLQSWEETRELDAVPDAVCFLPAPFTLTFVVESEDKKN